MKHASSKKMKIYSTQELSALRNSCGCKTGMMFLLASVIACIAYFKYTNNMAPLHEHKVLATILIGLGGALIGKILGMSFDRLRYVRLKRRSLSEVLPNKFHR